MFETVKMAPFNADFEKDDYCCWLGEAGVNQENPSSRI
jgi:hypothetical protein